MSELHAVVFAYSEVGHTCLKELLRQGTTVQAVFTHTDNPTETRWFPSVAELAREEGIPVFTPDTLGDEEYSLLKSLRPDVVFSFYYRSMIAERFLSLPLKGAFNMHGSLLPKYRGRACVNWAVLHGETETGATLHHMVRRADAGDIVDREAIPILFEDTALDVSRKVAEAARVVLKRTLPMIADGTAPRTPQNEAEATLFGRRTPADGQIDWEENAVRIHNLVRAVTHPFPGAFTFHRGRKLFIWKTLVEAHSFFEQSPVSTASCGDVFPASTESCESVSSACEGLPPGKVLSIAPFRVSSGLDAVRILEWEYENPGVEAFVREGDILG